ncbi:MAG: BMP family ABC transporter substrate-binding protein [Clostridia bacterium]|nr:BMP family ABC transporter substrate-binding protein [Clostridia bacterium]
MTNKKIAVRAAAVLLSAMTLASCSGEAHIISYESGEVTKAAEESPEISKESIKAALLLPVDPAGGSCMSSAHETAFNAAADQLGIAATVIYDALPEDTETLTKDANVIFGSNYDYMNALDESAKANTDKLYSCFGGYKYNSTNYTNYYTAIYEAQYLAGITAGTNTKSGKIGIISEYSAEYPDSAAEINSFALGARAARSDAEIMVYSLGSRSDTSKAEEYTKSLIDKGCDVISIQCDTASPAKAASAKGVSFIGYGIDMSSLGEGCLTSVMWNLKDYYLSALTSASSGTWAGENYYGNLAGGAVELSTLSADADVKTQARIDSAVELIKNGQFKIFSNNKLVFDAAGKATVEKVALIDNKANVMISEDGASCFIYSGEELKAIDPSSVTSDKLASATMNYIVEGVTVIQ